VGGSALGWIKSAWSEGLSLARTVSATLETAHWDVFAVTGEAAKERLQAQDFRHGGLPRANCFAGLAAELSRRFEGQDLIVELSLAMPTDPVQNAVGAATATCGDEVYEMVGIGTDLGSVERTLRATDPAVIYNAFVVRGFAETSSCPTALLKAGKISVSAALTGAYDGEGFIFGVVVQ
jgi:hypothetical protein